MQLRKWHSIIICLALAQTAAGVEEAVDIDKVTYFCGNRLSDMLSDYCHAYNTRRRKRQITECCNGLGCSVRYAIMNYCREIKPEYIHLFNKGSNENIDLSKESKKKLSDTLLTLKSGVRKVQPPDNDLKHSKLVSAIVNAANNMERETKAAGATNKQVRNRNSSHSSPRSLIANHNSSQRSFKRFFRRESLLGRHCQCKCKRRKHKKTTTSRPSSLSGSFIGTDYVPDGYPVHATAKDFMYPF